MTRAPATLVARFLPIAAAAVAFSAAPSAEAGLNAYMLAASKVSADIVVYHGEAYIPMRDVAEATRCAFEPTRRPAGIKAIKCAGGGLLETSAGSTKGYGGPNAKPTRHFRGDASDTQGFNPQPDPPKSLFVYDAVLSRRVLTAADGAYVPLADVAKAMGGKVRHRFGRLWISVKRKDARGAPLKINPKKI